MTEFGKIFQEVEQWEHFQTINCPKCDKTIRYHCLEIYAICPKCKTEQKVRAFGAVGTEIQDVIDAVLKWSGTGTQFDAVLKRHSIIQEDIEKKEGFKDDEK